MLFVEIVVALFVFLIAYQWLVFVVLAGRVARTGLHGDHARAIEQLGQIAKLPALTGDAGRIMTLFYLGDRCVVARRYSEALIWLNRLMSVKELPATLKPMIHERAADCYEALDRPQDAVNHRHFAANLADQSPTNYGAVLAKAGLFERQNQFDEACEVFEKALVNGKYDIKQRNILRAKLAANGIQAGKPEITIRYAEEALAGPIEPDLEVAVHQLVGTAYNGIGDRDRAEEHFHKSYKIAEQRNDRDHQAQALASLSGITRGRGRLTEALVTASRAVALSPKPNRMVNVYVCEILITLGRYEEAWRIAIPAGNSIAFLPHYQRTQSGVDSLILARICLEVGRPEDGLLYWRDGSAAFVNNRKMEAYGAAMGAALKAASGMADEARQDVSRLRESLAQATLSRITLIDCLSYLVRTSSLLGEHRDCMDFLEQYRPLDPTIADIPKTLYFAAESCVKAGDRSRALALFREAANTCPESIYADKCRARLEELGRI